VKARRGQGTTSCRLQQFLIGVKPRKQVIVVLVPGQFSSSGAAGRDEAVFKEVGHRDQLDIIAGVHGVGRRATSATTAANQSDSEAIVPPRVGGGTGSKAWSALAPGLVMS
jgi:hypothetical protein